ncbi:prepilin-type cleavage/methylation domain-containing protein [Methylobacterium radiotolerans]|uniref:prepilin-type N-terminal cleavage/methylation domain-containing protein n=1 Tax=Deinococcus ficus TaxID=317577 RepID=UPI0003B4BCA6|nr:prepilin-type N-terminal cleavage/methylation domain-containing protein [Deinococcus ficus]PJI54139.1 prepilin-type cleavage/methylation domain-containing protein [Methylobacterium radiotolerans]
MKAQSSGLTLIEILVALAIFAVVAAAVLAMFPTIFKVNGQTRADQAVTIGAKQFMEQARAAMDTVTEFDSVTAAASLPAAPDATKVNNYSCVRALNSQPDPSIAAGQIKRVTLTCTHSTYAQQVFTLDLGRPL